MYIYVNKGQNENEPSVWEHYFIVNCIDSVVLFPVWLLLYHRLSDCIWVWVSKKIVSKVVSSQHSSRWLHSFPLFLLFLSQDVLVASGFTVEESSAAQDRTLHPCHLLLSGNDACLYVRTLVVLYLSYLVKKKKVLKIGHYKVIHPGLGFKRFSLHWSPSCSAYKTVALSAGCGVNEKWAHISVLIHQVCRQLPPSDPKSPSANMKKTTRSTEVRVRAPLNQWDCVELFVVYLIRPVTPRLSGGQT